MKEKVPVAKLSAAHDKTIIITINRHHHHRPSSSSAWTLRRIATDVRCERTARTFTTATILRVCQQIRNSTYSAAAEIGRYILGTRINKISKKKNGYYEPWNEKRHTASRNSQNRRTEWKQYLVMGGGQIKKVHKKGRPSKNSPRVDPISPLSPLPNSKNPAQSLSEFVGSSATDPCT